MVGTLVSLVSGAATINILCRFFYLSRTCILIKHKYHIFETMCDVNHTSTHIHTSTSFSAHFQLRVNVQLWAACENGRNEHLHHIRVRVYFLTVFAM